MKTICCPVCYEIIKEEDVKILTSLTNDFSEDVIIHKCGFKGPKSYYKELPKKLS